MSLFPDYGPNGSSDRPWLDARRILYLDHHGLGDAIAASAALKSLRDAFPSAYLVATFISEPIAQLFNSVELIDSYLTYRSGLTKIKVDPFVNDWAKIYAALTSESSENRLIATRYD